MSLLLALDLGTSSSRATLYEADSMAPVPGAIHQIAHEPVHSPDGGATLDPDAIVEELVACAEQVLALGGGRPILGVGMSAFWHSVVGVAADGRATTPILLWSDLRSAPQVAALRTKIDPAHYSQRTGCVLHTSYVPGKLLYLAEARPEAFANTETFLPPSEYVFGRLFGWGRLASSVSMASATGLWDQKAHVYDAETLRCLPGLTTDRLPPVGDDPISGLQAPYRSRLAAVADVPWFPALGDGACSNVGCGASRPGDTALMIGTSGALRMAVKASEPPTLPAGLWRYQIDAGRYLIGGALSNGGNVWAWLKHTLQMPAVSDEAVESALATLAPDGHGLTVLPFFSGERAPLWRDDLRATIHGLNVGTTALQIIRANLEAVAYRFAAIREALRPIATGENPVIGTGAGLLKSPLWAQIIADAIGERIALSDEQQASSRGAALYARERLGRGPLEEAPPLLRTTTVTPNPATTRIYAEGRERQESLLRRLYSDGSS